MPSIKVVRWEFEHEEIRGFREKLGNDELVSTEKALEAWANQEYPINDGIYRISKIGDDFIEITENL